MDDIDICDKINKMRRDRVDAVRSRMHLYDKEMNEKIQVLQDQCSHSQTRPYYNFTGRVCGQECKFCGKIMMDINFDGGEIRE